MLLFKIAIGIDIVIECANRGTASCRKTARAGVIPSSVRGKRHLEYDPDSDFDPEGFHDG
jgi:hypothetical protein